MTPEEEILYNKFHIISVGLRRLKELMITEFDDRQDRCVRTIDMLIKESDEGMINIKE